MMVKQRYNDMLLAATEKLREVDAEINEHIGLDRHDRPIPVLVNDTDALFTISAMAEEYTAKLAILKLLGRNRDEVMDELFLVFKDAEI